MDWADTQQQAAFRAQVREVIEQGLPSYYTRTKDEVSEEGGGFSWVGDRVSSDPKRRNAAIEWGRVLAERGWFAPHWPKEYGGGGLTPMEQFIYNQELAEAGAPFVGGSGVSLLGPTLIVHGNDESVSAFLDHSSLAVTSTYLRRLEGQADEAWRGDAAAIAV